MTPPTAMLSVDDIAALDQGRHPDPFSVLGMHRCGTELCVHAVLPGALGAQVIARASGVLLATMQRQQETAVFCARLGRRAQAPDYLLRVTWPPLRAGDPPWVQDIDDPDRKSVV